MGQGGEAPDIDVVRPYAAALSLLPSDVPDADAGAAKAVLLEALQAVYTSPDPFPRWVQLLVRGA